MRGLLICALAALLLRDGLARPAQVVDILTEPAPMAHAASGRPATAGAPGPSPVQACTRDSFQGEPLCANVPLPTPWSGAVDPEAPLPDYPRPQLRRSDWLSLNGVWRFKSRAASTSDEGWAAEPERRIIVPFPPEAPLSGVRDHDPQHSEFEYRRNFSIPDAWQGRSVLLHFDAVDHTATVHLNGHRLGSHSGGYARFSFDVTHALRGGANELLLRASDPTEAAAVPIGKQRRWPPRRSICYTATSGIWQTVWLEPVPEAHVSRLELIPDVDGGRLRVTVHGSEAAAGARVAVAVSASGDRVAAAGGTVGRSFHVAVPGAKLWSPDSPFLYDLDVQLQPGPAEAGAAQQPGSSLPGRAVRGGGDRVAAYFGMRKASVGRAADGSLRPLLNNEFVFQTGMLDQGFWPDGIYTPAADAALLYDLNLTQQLGFNLLRKHIKVESDRWYHHADRMGLLVWQDMPAMFFDNQALSPRVKAAFRAELQEIMLQHASVPSIVAWVIFNEGWGQHDTMELVDFARSIDGSRILNAASGWNDFPVGDLVDRHDYPGPSAPNPTATRAAVLGEYGGLGMRVEGHMLYPNDSFSYVMYDRGYQLEARFAGLAADLERLMADPRSGLGASVYTEVSDVEGEVNGWVTYDRQVVKVDPAALREANRRLIARSRALGLATRANASAAVTVA